MVRVLVVLAGLLGVFAAAVLYAGNWMYGQQLAVDPACHGATPFATDSAKLAIADNPLSHQIDPDIFSGIEPTSFPSRDGKVEVSALFYRDPNNGPLVVTTHGWTSCKHHRHGLTILGMLASQGFSVLAIDMREHGESTVLDGVAAMGSDEFNDILGAFDFARTQLGFDTSRVGFWGESMGAAATLIANTHEDLGPLFVDAPFSTVMGILKDNANRANLPAWTIELIAPGVTIFRGNDLGKTDPLDGLLKRPAQPVFWVHGTADKTTDVYHAVNGAEAAAAFPAKTFWYTEGSGHVQSMWDRPTEYRTALLAFFNEHLKG